MSDAVSKVISGSFSIAKHGSLGFFKLIKFLLVFTRIACAGLSKFDTICSFSQLLAV